MTEMVVVNQITGLLRLNLLGFWPEKTKNPAVNPAVSFLRKKERPPKWPKLLVEMRGLEPLTSCMRSRGL